MLRRLANNQDRRSLAMRFRRQRFALFLSLLSRLEKPVRILDIGGTESYWKMMEIPVDAQVFVTLLNLKEETVSLPNLKSLAGDACNLNMSNGSFDIAFSNSVIEHVGSYHDQQRMANEVRRVGKHYFVQTPNKNFPIEPHFLFPFFQFLTPGIRVWFLRNFALGWFAKTPNAKDAREIIESVHLLTRAEFVRLFPGSSLYEEKILGLTKSFIVYGGWSGE